MMRHRIYHSMNLRQRLPDFSKQLDLPIEELEKIYEWFLENGYIFEEETKEGTSVSVCSIRLESLLEDVKKRRFFDAIMENFPSKRIPKFGINWETFIDRCLRIWEQIYNIIINKIPSHTIRLLWLKAGGAKIGKGSTIWRNTEVLGVENLVMGDDSTIAWHCQVDARAGLIIGDHVTVASHVLIIAGSHDLTAPEFWSVSAPIYIDDYAWIASRALIGHGAHIGEGAVVTAHTIVSKPVAPYKIVGGSGAKPMGERPHDLTYKVGGKGLFTLLH